MRFGVSGAGGLEGGGPHDGLGEGDLVELAFVLESGQTHAEGAGRLEGGVLAGLGGGGGGGGGFHGLFLVRQRLTDVLGLGAELLDLVVERLGPVLGQGEVALHAAGVGLHGADPVDGLAEGGFFFVEGQNDALEGARGLDAGLE